MKTTIEEKLNTTMIIQLGTSIREISSIVRNGDVIDIEKYEYEKLYKKLLEILNIYSSLFLTNGVLEELMRNDFLKDHNIKIEI